jgi:hypothetical protein
MHTDFLFRLALLIYYIYSVFNLDSVSFKHEKCCILMLLILPTIKKPYIQGMDHYGG